MITLEQFSIIHMSMAMAMGDKQKELDICKANGITIEEWETGKAHYYAKMADPSDGGKTAAAMAAAAMNNLPNMMNTGVAAQRKQREIPEPTDFTATIVAIYLNEHEVQMIEFNSADRNQYVTLQHTPKVDPADEFLTNYVQGRAHISINEQSYSIYGGVTKVELTNKTIKFIFDEEGAERMKSKSVTVTFDIPGKQYEHLEYMLTKMYGSLLHIATDSNNDIYTFNGTQYNLQWANFVTDKNKINIRPNLENIKATNYYPMVVLPVFKKGTINDAAQEKELFDDMLQSLIAVLESDLNSLIAFYLENEEQYQLYIYTHLDQGAFMKRINEALAYLPQLPLTFGGGEDAVWNNYSGCMEDYLASK